MMYGRSEKHKRLKDRNEEMTRLRFEERLTYREIGERFGITGGRAREVIQSVIRRKKIPSWQNLYDRVKVLENEHRLIIETFEEMEPITPDDDPYTLGWKGAWGMVANIARRALGD